MCNNFESEALRHAPTQQSVLLVEYVKAACNNDIKIASTDLFGLCMSSTVFRH